MGTTILRPDALIWEGPITNIGGGSVGDQNDSSYKILAPPSGTHWHLSNISGVDGTVYRIEYVHGGVTMSWYNGGFTIDAKLEVFDTGGARDILAVGGTGSEAAHWRWGNALYDRANGGEWTQDAVNEASMKFRDDGGGSTAPQVHEMALYVVWRQRPNVSNVGPSGTNPGATRRPNVTWSFSDPDGMSGQAAYHVKVFSSWQSNPDVGGAVWDSGAVGSGAGSRTIDTNLSDGTYYVYVKVAKLFRNGWWWSAWGSTSFTLSFPPGAPAGLQRTGEESDTTPNFAVYLSDLGGQQAKARFEVYQSNRTTLIGTVDSAYLSADGTASAEYSSALGIGTYSVRAKSIDSGGTESGYTGWVDFDVTQIVTKDLSLRYDVKQEASKSLNLNWDVNANNIKELRINWDVLGQLEPKDVKLVWDVETPWVKVPEGASTWTKVREL